jgi:choline dehydrogenase-like flavoprotein
VARWGDPTEPPHSAPYPFPPVPDEPTRRRSARRKLRRAGPARPGPLPLGVDHRRLAERRGTTWDAFPNTRGGKMDAESCALAGRWKHPNVTLLTGARVTRLLAEGRRVTGVEVIREGKAGDDLTAPLVCLAAGAVMSSALLLASADAATRAALPTAPIRSAAIS